MPSTANQKGFLILRNGTRFSCVTDLDTLIDHGTRAASVVLALALHKALLAAQHGTATVVPCDADEFPFFSVGGEVWTQPQAALGREEKEMEELWCINIPGIVIKPEPAGRGFQAHVEGKPADWSRGDTRDEAAGSLIRRLALEADGANARREVD